MVFLFVFLQEMEVRNTNVTPGTSLFLDLDTKDSPVSSKSVWREMVSGKSGSGTNKGWIKRNNDPYLTCNYKNVVPIQLDQFALINSFNCKIFLEIYHQPLCVRQLVVTQFVNEFSRDSCLQGWLRILFGRFRWVRGIAKISSNPSIWAGQC